MNNIINPILEKYSGQCTAGIVGAGKLGMEIRRRAAALGMNTLLCDPPRAAADSEDIYGDILEQWGNGMGGCDPLENSTEIFIPLNSLLMRADLIFIQVPLTFSGEWPTSEMIDPDTLALLKPDAVIYDLSDAGVVSADALKDPRVRRIAVK